MGIVILTWYLLSLYFSINMIVRVKNHKGVKNPKLVLCLNIVNVVGLVLWILWVLIVLPGRECMVMLLLYLIISIPIMVVNIVQYRNCLR